MDRQCATFCNELQAARNTGEFASGTLTAVTAAAGTILSIASAGTVAIGTTMAALGGTSAILASYRRSALLSEYPDELQQLVQNAQQAFVTAQQRADSRELTVEDADRLVSAYASYCTLPRMHALAREALAAAKPQERPSTPPAPPSPAPVGGAPAGAPAAAPLLPGSRQPANVPVIGIAR